jgi:hypothetical protein
VGFKVDEYSELTQTYRVRQAHAHAWVEAYIPADRLPTGAARPDGISDWSHGGWLRLDPTPSFSTAPTGVARQMENWLSLLHSFWRDHVVSMNANRQRDALYRPLIVQIRNAAAELSEPRLESQADAGSLVRLGLSLLAAAFIGAALAVGAWLFYEPWRAWRQGVRRTRADARIPAGSNGRTSVAFYARWEALLARRGYVRAAAQTQREFSAEAAQQIAADGGDQRILEWARQIIQAFYTVRFGPGTLGDEQAAVVEAALHEVQQAGNAKRL